MEIQMTEEALSFICAVIMLETSHVFWIRVRWQEGDFLTGEAGANTVYSFGEFVGRLRVESNALKVLTTLVAGETLRMESTACC